MIKFPQSSILAFFVKHKTAANIIMFLMLLAGFLSINKLNRQFLHAKTLGFIHPKKNKEMIFNSILPNELEIILKKLRNTDK